MCRQTVKQLPSLLESVHDASITGDISIPVTGIADDSRLVTPGDLFCAIEGTLVDGARFIEEAIHRGAVAVVTHAALPYPVPVITVGNTRKALGSIASAWYDHPSSELDMVAITGTDGKTSVSYIISRMMSYSGIRFGYIGTLGAHAGEKTCDSSHTTPPPLILQRILREMVNDSCRGVSMEASSHGLKQDRLSGIVLRSAVFTTFGRDHLDYHVSSDEYLRSKLSIFRYLGEDGTAVVNARFPEVVVPASRESPRTLRFSTGKGEAEVTVGRVEERGTVRRIFLNHGTRHFTVDTVLHGSFQIENIAAAAAAGIALGLDYGQIRRGIESVKYIPGRFEPVYHEDRLRAIIDYAHTPGALRNALSSARALTSGRLVVVFGCGGDRDTGKRPLMGRIAADLADIVIVTSDNPRSEDPESIISDIVSGVSGASCASDIIRISHRRRAIAEAIQRSSKHDIILIAGKGHEKTQTIGGQVLTFDDCSVTRELLELQGQCGS